MSIRKREGYSRNNIVGVQLKLAMALKLRNDDESIMSISMAKEIYKYQGLKGK